MSYVPLLLVQEPAEEKEPDLNPADMELVAIAVYANQAGVPVTVSTRRLFVGERQFYFPTEVTEGAAKTRIVYRHTLAQWRELLESMARPEAPGAVKQLMISMLLYLRDRFPALFSDLDYDRSFDREMYAQVLPMK